MRAYRDKRYRFPLWSLSSTLVLLLLAAAAAPIAAAQDASPAASPSASPVAGGTPVASFDPVTSITRQEFADQLFEAFPMEEPENEGGEIIWGQPSDLSTVNPILGGDQPTNPFLGLVFESLVSTSPIDGQPAPGLADYWERADDGMTYTFYLNEDAAFHDGTDVTAEDVEFSLDAVLNLETGSFYTSSTDEAVDSYRVVDEKTFEITSNGPRANFFFDLFLPIVPMHIWGDVPAAEWAQDPGSTGQDPSRVIGSGPFKFVEWVQQDHATLERNEDYWDTVSSRVPVVDRFTMQVFPDETTLVQALKTGEVDFYDDVPPGEVEGLRNTEGMVVEEFPTFDFGYFAYNLDPEKTPLFQDREVRQALLMALDRDAIIDNIFLGLGEVAVGTQSLLSDAYSPDSIEDPYTFDLERAAALLEEAGWVDENDDGVREKDGNELRIEMTYTEAVATYEQLVPYMQQQWRDIGVELIANPVPFPTLIELYTETHEFDIVLLGFSWVADPDQKTMFACDQYEGGFNAGKYCNPEYDALALPADTELDPETRLQMLIDASAIAWADLPVAIYRFGVDVAVNTERLHNYYPLDYAYTIWSMPFVWLEQQ